MGSPCSTPLQDERFLLLEALGRGGMGTVYRAFDRAEQRLVALKVPCTPDDPGPAHPLAAEFDNWWRLRHPNIVRVYEMCHAESGPIPEGTPYLVLQHVEGRPAHRALGTGRAEDSTVETFAAQVLSALAHVHASGYVHRDLKPGNVLEHRSSGRRPRYMLTDFGLATKTGAARPLGTFSGSLPYVAPECLLGLPLDGRADLYGLGVLLYRLVTGRLPMSDGGPREILHWHLGGPPADPACVRAGISPRLSRFIRRLTMRDPAERPATATSAMHMLGLRAAAGRNRARVDVTARGTLASLRLALDSVRLGALRVFRLPGSTRVAEGLLEELFVWSQVRGLRFYRLTDDPERLVLRLLADRGVHGAALVRRFGLRRWLALDVLGGVPLLDPARTRASPTARFAARAIGGLITDCALHRPIVLCAGTEPGSPFVQALKRRLARYVAANDAAKNSRGGLLLVVDSDWPEENPGRISRAAKPRPPGAWPTPPRSGGSGPPDAPRSAS
jgi:hypothetical protein